MNHHIPTNIITATINEFCPVTSLLRSGKSNEESKKNQILFIVKLVVYTKVLSMVVILTKLSKSMNEIGLINNILTRSTVVVL